MGRVRDRSAQFSVAVSLVEEHCRGDESQHNCRGLRDGSRAGCVREVRLPNDKVRSVTVAICVPLA
jgi:hypothetical protein